MASNNLEILDSAPESASAAQVEKNDQHETPRPAAEQLNRRFFMAALGIAGAAAGTAMLAGKPVEAQQAIPNGYNPVDVLNFLLQVKYLKATLYSYITQGADLPASSNVTMGTGTVLNAPAKIAFTTQQITDIFNEMYYDELNQLITLRSLLGAAVAPRATMNILGNGTTTSLTTTLTQTQAIALSRMLEDLSASAFTTASAYLSGLTATNPKYPNFLSFVTQALATDAMHAGAIRLISIQNNIPYMGTQFASYATTTTTQTPNTFNGETIVGNSLIYANLPVPAPAAVPNGPPANLPAVGNILSGVGIPFGVGAIVTAVNYVPPITLTAVSNKSTTLTNVSSLVSLATLAQNQPITGTYIPASTYIAGLGSNSITLSQATTTASTVAPTGFVTANSNVITGVSSFSGILPVASTPPPSITGTGIPPNTIITGVNASAGTITMSNNATATSATAFTGGITNGSNTVTSVSTLIAVGSGIFGTGIQNGTTVTAQPTGTSLTLSLPATVTNAKAALSTPVSETLTTPTTVTYTVTQSTVTIAGAATATGYNSLSVIIPDNEDVEPGDPGSAATSAGGPSALANTSPTVYQGFFNTAGANTTAATGTLPGFAFARTFQQVLSVLYGYNTTNSIIATQTYQGGYYPLGVTGNITSTL